MPLRLAPIVLGISLLMLPSSWANHSVSFNRDVRPILADRCFHCHGPDEHDRQAELRLDESAGEEGAYRMGYETPAIKPGSLDESEVWRRLTTEEEYERMPPVDSPKKQLTDEEKEIIKQWILSGAEYQDFWAFVPPRHPELVEDRENDWSGQPIDQTVLRRLEEDNLSPNRQADKRTLIRRVTYDLTGLPPTRAEIHNFLNDRLPDAYERLVDRLIAKPQYGEHMAKYWLDLVRFADTNGMHHDHYREMSPYRDWVIRAFNENLPYDDFSKYQLAGDLYSEPTNDQLIASGFNRLHLIIDVGTALPEESHVKNVVDRVTAVGTAFMGLTVQCAVCHDHKYDPITTKDFYQLYAFFNNFDGEPETGRRHGTDFKLGLQKPYISLATADQQIQIDNLQLKVKNSKKKVSDLEGRLNHLTDKSAKKDLETELASAKTILEAAETDYLDYLKTIDFALVMKEKAEPRPAHILSRGVYDDPGEQVQRGTPEFLPLLETEGTTPSRMDLANWFVSPEHPLTARVAVNRFWQQLFGVGIVKTTEDFGAQGEWPSHPELLDYLALSFVESGWNVKALMKQIIMSATYQQSSIASPEQFTKDPENRLLTRGSRFRLDAELIRDSVLATSGLLNQTMYGKSVKPPQPEGLWKAVNMPSSYPKNYHADSGNKIYRRSLYTFWKRGMPPPQMTIMNAPSREACIARRERTNTPLQALLLMNEPEYLKAARHLANQSLANRALSSTERLEFLYETITAYQPTTSETTRMLKLVQDLEALYSDNAALAVELCQDIDLHDDVAQSELAAWTILVNTIYNLDITKTRG